MDDMPVLRAGRGAPGAKPGTLPTESQFTRNINAMNRLSDKLDGFIRVSHRIHEATTALDGKISAHSEQLARSSAAHKAATEEHIGQMRIVIKELRATTRALMHLSETIGRNAAVATAPPPDERGAPGKPAAGKITPPMTRTGGRK